RDWSSDVCSSDLVAAGVVEVLALEEDPRAAGVLGEPLHLGERRRATGVGVQQTTELGLERRIGDRLLVRDGEFVDGRDERLGHIAPAEVPEERAGLLS